MKDLLISHIADIDGVSPVILLKLCERNFDYHLLEIKDVDLFISELLDTDLSEYENIYVTDLTLGEDTYEKIEKNESRNKWKIFDHHISHSYALKYPYVTLNTKECGTTLFYQYLKKLYPLEKKSISMYVSHVLDLDIWCWEEKNNVLAKYLGDLHAIYGNDIYIEKMYDRLLKEETFSLSPFEEELLLIEQGRIERYASKKEENLLVFQYQNYKMGVVYADQYRSELGHILHKRNPELDFIAVINPNGGISLRTENEDVNLSILATSLGGGGHKKASGLTFPAPYRVRMVEEIFEGAVLDENR